MQRIIQTSTAFIIISFMLLSLPAISLAQNVQSVGTQGPSSVSMQQVVPSGAPGAQQTSTIQDAIRLVVNILNTIIPVLIAIAIVWFIISILQYIFKSGEEDKAKAKQNMIWGIIGIVVIVSIWGLVNLLTNTLNLDNSAPSFPCIVDPSTGACI